MEANQNPSPEVRAERRWHYRLMLQQILETPILMLQLAALEKITFQEAYVQVDTRIRGLQEEEKK